MQQQYDFWPNIATCDDIRCIYFFTQAHGGVYGTNEHNYHYNVNTQKILIIPKQFFLLPVPIVCHQAVLHSSCSEYRFFTLMFVWARSSAPHLKHIASLTSARKRERTLWSQESSAFCHICLFWHILVFCCSFILFYFKSLAYLKIMFLFWHISFVAQFLFCLLFLLHLHDMHAWHVLLTFSSISLTYLI